MQLYFESKNSICEDWNTVKYENGFQNKSYFQWMQLVGATLLNWKNNFKQNNINGNTFPVPDFYLKIKNPCDSKSNF